MEADVASKEQTDSVTLSLAQDTSGQGDFEIVVTGASPCQGSKIRANLTTGWLADFEVKHVYTVRLTATDPGWNSAPAESGTITVTITIRDQNDAPTLASVTAGAWSPSSTPSPPEPPAIAEVY